MMMMESKETLNYFGEKPYAIAHFVISMEEKELKGSAWMEGFESLKVEAKEPLDGVDPFRAVKNMKYWLEADLCNMILEFENGMSK